MEGDGGQSFYSMAFGGSETAIPQNLVLPGCLFLVVCLFAGAAESGFFCLRQLAFPGCCLHLKSGIHEGIRNQETHFCVIPWVLRPLAGLAASLHLSESSYICIKHNVQGFYLYFPGGIRKIRSTPSS